MDLSHPIHAVIPSLDGPVLEVLARTTRALTGREVHRLAETGSENGVRAVLNRLAAHGIVHADPRATASFYTLNRQHLAAPAVEILAGLRNGLIDRLRDTVGSWDPAPAHVSIFGSVARGDGKTESDIDVLLIRATETEPGSEHWTEQTDALTEGVHAWTGNYCQLYELSREELAHHIRANEPIVESWRREAITLFGPDFRQLVRRLA